ncbi:MAG: molybdenum cofactor guanylyltransferase MobA [Burkholderiaceae bacterium]
MAITPFSQDAARPGQSTAPGIAKSQIAGVVLAGGRGARMGGLDKGLQLFGSVPLALHTLRRLQQQVGSAMVNANRHIDAYAAFGVPVWPDALADYAGPLAGFITALQHCPTPYLATVPCDTPLFPQDLVARLAQAMQRDGAEIAMAWAPEPGPDGQTHWRAQPVFCLLRTSLLESLQDFTARGGRKIDAWTATHNTVLVPFDDQRAFFNVNTLDELKALQP